MPIKYLIADRVVTYIVSINNADADLASTVWLTSPDVSLIHPRGREHGWDAIAENFYGGTMGALLADRKLRLAGPLAIQQFGDNLTIAEFEWSFNGTLRDSGKALQLSGRASQVFANFAEQGWRIVHVHHSGRSQVGACEGF